MFIRTRDWSFFLVTFGDSHLVSSVFYLLFKVLLFKNRRNDGTKNYNTWWKLFVLWNVNVNTIKRCFSRWLLFQTHCCKITSNAVVKLWDLVFQAFGLRNWNNPEGFWRFQKDPEGSGKFQWSFRKGLGMIQGMNLYETF